MSITELGIWCVLSRFLCFWLFATIWTASTRLLCPWDIPGKNTGVCCCALLQGIFLTQWSNLPLLRLLHCRWILYCWATGEAPNILVFTLILSLHWDYKFLSWGWKYRGISFYIYIYIVYIINNTHNMLGYIWSSLWNNMVYYFFPEIWKLPLTVNNFSHPIERLDY